MDNNNYLLEELVTVDEALQIINKKHKGSIVNKGQIADDNHWRKIMITPRIKVFPLSDVVATARKLIANPTRGLAPAPEQLPGLLDEFEHKLGNIKQSIIDKRRGKLSDYYTLTEIILATSLSREGVYQKCDYRNNGTGIRTAQIGRSRLFLKEDVYAIKRAITAKRKGKSNKAQS